MATLYEVGGVRVWLEAAPEGGFVVTGADDPSLVTQGETVAECLEMASDAAACLDAANAYRRTP